MRPLDEDATAMNFIRYHNYKLRSLDPWSHYYNYKLRPHDPWYYNYKLRSLDPWN